MDRLELKICEAIGARRLLEFDYGGSHRVVQPYCHGFTRKGAETLRAVQISSESSDSGSGGRGFGKLWTVLKMQNLRVASQTFVPDDPDYNPDDSALLEIHCCVKPARRPVGVQAALGSAAWGGASPGARSTSAGGRRRSQTSPQRSKRRST